MADIANLKVGTTTYSLKDSTARTSASNALQVSNNADKKADQAISDSASATATANTANNTANTANAGQLNANTKIDGASILGTYTDSTETLEISLKLGGKTNVKYK